ncbi:MAG: hypothetical protein QGH45_11840 [Myxococcota bacterium]|nr:hypothetical protein [Myxococcota bacterium]
MTSIPLSGGCTLEYYAAGMEEQGIVALFPGDGAAAVPEDTPLRIELAWDSPADRDVIAWLGESGDELEPLACVHDWTIHVVECLPPAPLRSNTEYIFAAQLPSRPARAMSSTFQTATPEGLGYEIGAELGVTELGSNGLAGPVLNTQLTVSGPLLLVSEHLDTADDLPALASNWVWGPGKRLEAQPGQPYVIRENVGYPFAAPTVVGEGGTIFGSATYAYLPVTLGGEWRHVRVDGLAMFGQLDPTDPDLPVDDLTIEGYVKASSLLRALADVDDTEASGIRNLVDLDTDTDGDGQLDAAHLVLKTRPIPIAIHDPS